MESICGRTKRENHTKLTKTFRFEASHILPLHPGKCSRLHGHSWVLHVSVEGEVDLRTGFVMDYADISRTVKPLIERLDHRHLGQWAYANKKVPIAPVEEWKVPELPEDFYPTSENLLVWIGEQLTPVHVAKPNLDQLERMTLGGVIPTTDITDTVITLAGSLNWSELTLEETCTSSATLRRIKMGHEV